jgi:hypothetical protein
VDKFGVDSNAVVTAEFSLAEAFKRTKLTFAAKDQTRNTALKEDKRTATATIGAEHRAEVGTFTAEADPLARVASVTALGGYRGFFAGGSVKASLVSFKAEEYGAVVGYKARGATVAIAGEKNFATIAASYHQVRCRASAGCRWLWCWCRQCRPRESHCCVVAGRASPGVVAVAYRARTPAAS